MKIDILCDSMNHPILPLLQDWVEGINSQSGNKEAKLCYAKSDVKGGDLLFLISCNQIIGDEIRDLYGMSLVIHASDLPKGRGWSPLVWQILEGKSEIVISLFEAKDPVDSGDIVRKEILRLDGTETYDEINNKLFAIELKLMEYAVNNFDNLELVPQSEEEISFYPKRTPKDSEIDIDKSLRDQINLLRVCDPDRYPAFFYHGGVKYALKINKIES